MVKLPLLWRSRSLGPCGARLGMYGADPVQAERGRRIQRGCKLGRHSFGVLSVRVSLESLQPDGEPRPRGVVLIGAPASLSPTLVMTLECEDDLPTRMLQQRDRRFDVLLELLGSELLLQRAGVDRFLGEFSFIGAPYSWKSQRLSAYLFPQVS